MNTEPNREYGRVNTEGCGRSWDKRDHTVARTEQSEHTKNQNEHSKNSGKVLQTTTVGHNVLKQMVPVRLYELGRVGREIER